MKINGKKIAVTAAGVAAGVLMLTGCNDKLKEPFKDAGVSQRNDRPADVGSMPDGFSNYATKCDRPGIRIYVIFHSDFKYGSITAIADPTCK
jgi:hypothetical protein